MRPLWVARLLLIFIGVPVVLALIIFDAICCAWDELRRDFRDAVPAFLDSWNDE